MPHSGSRTTRRVAITWPRSPVGRRRGLLLGSMRQERAAQPAFDLGAAVPRVIESLGLASVAQLFGSTAQCTGAKLCDEAAPRIYVEETSFVASPGDTNCAAIPAGNEQPGFSDINDRARWLAASAFDAGIRDL